MGLKEQVEALEGEVLHLKEKDLELESRIALKTGRKKVRKIAKKQANKKITKRVKKKALKKK